MTVVAFTGHRPKELFGSYTPDSEKLSQLSKNLSKVIEKLIIQKDADTFITGGALGVDQIAYVVVYNLKKKYPYIRNILAIPFKKQPYSWEKSLENAKKNNWSSAIHELEETLRKYSKMLDTADEVIYVDELSEYQPKNMKLEEIGEYSAAKLHLRNFYMVDQADFVVAVYNGSNKGGTYNCVKYAKEQKKTIIVLDPNDNFSAKIHKP